MESPLIAVEAPEATARGITLTLGGDIFTNGRADLKAGGPAASLDRLVAFVNGHPRGDVMIEGHTDNQGNSPLNNALSIRRANSVARYLTERGVDPSRLAVRGYGARRPLVSNDDEVEGRELNRRIELSLIKVAGRGTVAE